MIFNEGQIIFQLKSENKSEIIKFPGQQIEVKELKKLISNKLGNKDELIIYDSQTLQEYTDAHRLRTNTKIMVERKVKTLENSFWNNQYQCKNCQDKKNLSKTLCCNMYICKTCKERNRYKCSLCQMNLNKSNFKSNNSVPIQPLKEELDEICNNARFFIIKSCNQDNINSSKEHSVWATTMNNQRRLNEAFQNSQNTILIFSANKNPCFQGCARMESQANTLPNAQQSMVDRMIWKNTESIRLGGNFKIRWLRIGCVTFQQIQNLINPLTNEPVIKSRDCQEIQRDHGKHICMLFDHPVVSEEAEFSEQEQQISIQESIQDEIQTGNYEQQSNNNVNLQENIKSDIEQKNEEDKEEKIDYDELINNNQEKEEEHQQQNDNCNIINKNKSVSESNNIDISINQNTQEPLINTQQSDIIGASLQAPQNNDNNVVASDSNDNSAVQQKDAEEDQDDSEQKQLSNSSHSQQQNSEPLKAKEQQQNQQSSKNNFDTSQKPKANMPFMPMFPLMQMYNPMMNPMMNPMYSMNYMTMNTMSQMAMMQQYQMMNQFNMYNNIQNGDINQQGYPQGKNFNHKKKFQQNNNNHQQQQKPQYQQQQQQNDEKSDQETREKDDRQKRKKSHSSYSRSRDDKDRDRKKKDRKRYRSRSKGSKNSKRSSKSKSKSRSRDQKKDKKKKKYDRN